MMLNNKPRHFFIPERWQVDLVDLHRVVTLPTSDRTPPAPVRQVPAMPVGTLLRAGHDPIIQKGE
jgi:hypothetical protein